MATNTLQTFTAFYNDWLLRLHHLQDQLTAAAAATTAAAADNVKDQELNTLVQQATEHYRQYYEEKSHAIKKDVFLIMSPPWYTSFEQALFWVSEFPPSLVFRFVSDLDLTAEQGRRVEAVRVEIGRKEAMAMVQESLAAAPLYGLVNRTERLVDGEVSELDVAMEEVKEAMRVVMVEADGLRVAAVAEVLECLVVGQRVRFFAKVGEFRIRARRIGLQMER